MQGEIPISFIEMNIPQRLQGKKIGSIVAAKMFFSESIHGIFYTGFLRIVTQQNKTL